MEEKMPAFFRQLIRVLLLLSIMTLLFAGHIFADNHQQKVKIGILKKESIGGWDYDWQGTIDILNRRIKDHSFSMELMTWQDLRQAINSQEVDFVISSPVFSVESDLEGLTTIIATVKRENEKLEAFDNLFGSVIFWKAGNKEIKTLWDMRNKKIAAGPVVSIGGWLGAAREFAERGIDLRKACREIDHFVDTRKILEAVLNNEADFGICRTSSLEQIAQDEGFDLSQINFSRELYQHTDALPFACSTRLYPEWSFSRAKQDRKSTRLNSSHRL
jgi:two-component system sensor histidine kinase TtrS